MVQETMNRLGNPILKALLRSRLHGVVSRSFAVITVRGRKTGMRHAIPVNYVQQGDTAIIVSRRDRTWWRNLRRGAAASITLRGREEAGWGEAFEDAPVVASGLAEFVRLAPGAAKYHGLRMGDGGEVIPETLTAAAGKLVIVRLRLGSKEPSR